MGAPVVHFEIGSTDPTSLVGFYRDVFGWNIEAMPGTEPYLVVDTRSARGIYGGIGHGEADYVTFYAGVDDIHASLARAEELGGKVAVPVQVIPDVVTFALFTDPQGNLIGLVSNEGAPPDRVEAGGAPVTHFEINSPNITALHAFYQQLFGWTIHADNPMNYGLVHAEPGAGIGGGLGQSETGNSVTFYAEVPDLEATLAKVVALGGSIVHPVMEIPDMVTFAIFADPQGHVIGLAKSSA